jgi:hypothetical protein
MFIGPSPEPHEFRPYLHTLFLIKIIFYKTLLDHNCISNISAENFKTYLIFSVHAIVINYSKLSIILAAEALNP